MEYDRPAGKNLLEAAISLMHKEVLPNMPAAQKLNLLMISKAMAITVREFEGLNALQAAAKEGLAGLYSDKANDNFEEFVSDFAADIRSGRFDENETVYSILKENTRRRLKICNPRYLKFAENR